MKFTATPPKKPGLYWCKLNSKVQDVAHIARVYGDAPFLRVEVINFCDRTFMEVKPYVVKLWGEKIPDANDFLHEVPEEK